MTTKNAVTKALQCALWLWPLRLMTAQAGSQPPPPAAATHSEPVTTGTTLVQDPNGVSLRLEQTVSSEFAHKGDRIRLTLLNDLSDGSSVLAPAGSTFYAKVAQVKATDHRHPAKLEVSDATLDLGNWSQLRLKRSDGQDDLLTPGAIPVLVVGAVTLVPITVALVPIQLPYLAVHDIHERKQQRAAGTPKPWFIDIELPQGQTLTYYADRGTLTRHKPIH